MILGGKERREKWRGGREGRRERRKEGVKKPHIDLKELGGA